MLGPDQRFYRLSERSVRALARERGVTELIVDPRLVAAPVSETLPNPVSDPAPEPALVPEPVRVTEPEAVSIAADRLSRRVQALRAAWSGSSAGVLTVSALTGAAAVAMEVLK